MLLDDKDKLEEERRRREEEARQRELELNQEFENLQEQDEEWWNQQHELDQIEEPKEDNKPIVQKSRKKSAEIDEDYKFKNPYVYNQGDADM